MPSKKQRAKTRKQNSSSTAAGPSTQAAPTNLTTTTTGPIRNSSAAPAPLNLFANLTGAEAAALLSELHAHNASNATSSTSLSHNLPPHPSNRQARWLAEREARLLKNNPTPEHPIYLLASLQGLYNASTDLGIHWRRCADESCFLSHIVLPSKSYLRSQPDAEGQRREGSNNLVDTLDTWPNVMLEHWRFQDGGPGHAFLYALPRFMFGSLAKRGVVARDVRRRLRDRERKCEGQGQGERMMIAEKALWKRRHVVPVFRQLGGSEESKGRFLGWWRVKSLVCYGEGSYRSLLAKGEDRVETVDSKGSDCREEEEQEQEQDGPQGKGKGKEGDEKEGCTLPYWLNFCSQEPMQWIHGHGCMMLTFQEISCVEMVQLDLAGNVFQICEEVRWLGGKGFVGEEWDGEEWSSEGEDGGGECECCAAIVDEDQEADCSNSSGAEDEDLRGGKPMTVQEVEWSVE